ncbi:MAG TPA: hypothetical protein VD814_00145 [Nocardioides sp.]|nr:hypothetical protein [Nocardioides sp.]
MRNRMLVAGAAVLAVTLVAAGLLWWRSAQTTELERAVGLAPAESARLTWTHWSEVRRTLGADDLSASSSVAALTGFLTDAYDADLSPMSSLLASAETMHREYGFSPATLEWELLSQSSEGAVVLMKLPEDTDFGTVGDRLASLGYERPGDETGVWRGGIDLLPSIGTLTPELQYLALDEEQGLVVASDRSGFLESALRTVRGDEEGATRTQDVVEAVGSPLAAAIYGGDHACAALAMGNAGPADQDQARELVTAAGEVSPLTGFAMAVGRDRDVRVAMSFESDDQARTNADSRAALASGPAPGQGGDFGDRFRLGEVTATGPVVTMELHPVRGSSVLSDLSSGPLLFATC